MENKELYEIELTNWLHMARPCVKDLFHRCNIKTFGSLIDYGRQNYKFNKGFGEKTIEQLDNLVWEIIYDYMKEKYNSKNNQHGK
jgi:hypothetical protein